MLTTTAPTDPDAIADGRVHAAGGEPAETRADAGPAGLSTAGPLPADAPGPLPADTPGPLPADAAVDGPSPPDASYDAVVPAWTDPHPADLPF